MHDGDEWVHKRSSWDGCSDSLSTERRKYLDVDTGEWVSNRKTYGSTNSSEREEPSWFLTAALSNDDSGTSRRDAGCLAPETGWPRYQIRSQSRGPFLVTFIEQILPVGELALFSKFAPGASRSVNGAYVRVSGAR